MVANLDPIYSLLNSPVACGRKNGLCFIVQASVVAEFSSVVLPKFQEQTIDAEQVTAFLRERLQANDLVVDGISRALSLVQRTDRE